jgi:hypothetical protein
MNKARTTADPKDEERLFQRVEALNLQLEYDSGFCAVTRSASADQRDDDDGEVEEALFEQLGKHLRDVAAIALGKSRGARAQAFVDRSAFVPAIQAFGTLQGCSADGIARVGFRRENFRDPEGDDVDRVNSGSGADLLLILDDERPAPASKTSFAWITDERLLRLFVRADQAGIRLEHDSGFTLVKLRPVDGVERKAVQEIIRELGAKLREVSAHMAARARGERGQNFVGRRVLVPAFFNAFGTIETSDVSGAVTVRYRDKHTQSERTCWCQGDALLLVPDKRATAEPAAGQNSETAWQRLMRRMFGG